MQSLLRASCCASRQRAKVTYQKGPFWDKCRLNYWDRNSICTPYKCQSFRDCLPHVVRSCGALGMSMLKFSASFLPFVGRRKLRVFGNFLRIVYGVRCLDVVRNCGCCLDLCLRLEDTARGEEVTWSNSCCRSAV